MRKNQWFAASSSRPQTGLSIVRIIVAILLAVHSITRMAKGDVTGFGEYLGSVGFPLGVALAWFITVSTLLSSIALVLNRLVIPASACHIIVLAFGIALDHVHDGWFVVGGGSNGMEYSVCLISCLVAVAWSYWPRKQ